MLEGSADGGTTWAEFPTADDAALLFSLNTNGPISPNYVFHGEFLLRIQKGALIAADASLTVPEIAGGTGGNEAYVSYEIWEETTPVGTCDANAATGPGGTGSNWTLRWSGSSLADGTPTLSGTAPTLAKPADEESAGASLRLCFKLAAASGLIPVDTAKGTWKLVATEKEG